MEEFVKERYGDEKDYKVTVGYQSVLSDIELAIDDEDRLPGSNVESKSEMDEKIEEIMESYGGGDESVSVSAYLEPDKEYGQKAALEDDGGEAENLADKIEYECSGCAAVFDAPGVCGDCDSMLRPKFDGKEEN
ncbi:MAG: hypothetical protein HY833_03755 [Candidatus Aenigmarchaeota archaeon]|nr:hypothetical protein [Candidatus Aenigmarchaeota archaeon]